MIKCEIFIKTLQASYTLLNFNAMCNIYSYFTKDKDYFFVKLSLYREIGRPNFVVMQSMHNVYPYVEIKIHVRLYFNSLWEIHVFVETKASIFKKAQSKLLTSDSMHYIHH